MSKTRSFSRNETKERAEFIAGLNEEAVVLVEVDGERFLFIKRERLSGMNTIGRGVMLLGEPLSESWGFDTFDTISVINYRYRRISERISKDELVAQIKFAGDQLAKRTIAKVRNLSGSWQYDYNVLIDDASSLRWAVNHILRDSRNSLSSVQNEKTIIIDMEGVRYVLSPGVPKCEIASNWLWQHVLHHRLATIEVADVCVAHLSTSRSIESVVFDMTNTSDCIVRIREIKDYLWQREIYGGQNNG